MKALSILAAITVLSGMGLAKAEESTAVTEPFELSTDPAAHVWRFRNLGGTPAKIQRILNSDVGRLADTMRQDEREIEEISREIEGEKRLAIKPLQNSESYRKVNADFDGATADLKAARAEHNSSAVINATNRLNEARSQIELRESKAIASSRQVRLDVDYLARLRYNLGEVRKSLEEAREYRAELVNALWNSFILEWPLHQGSKGILRDVIPSHVSSDGSFSATFAAFEPLSDGGEKEGITTTRGVGHSVTVLVLDCEDLSPKEGESLGIYRTLEVTERRELGGEPIYVLKRAHTDFDVLAEAIAAPISASKSQPTTNSK